MDTSLEYITECREAWALQREWQPAHGDYYYGDGTAYSGGWGENSPIMEELSSKNIFLCLETDSEGGHFHLEPEDILKKGKENFVWLPRQDQSQEMVGKIDAHNLICGIYHWYCKTIPTDTKMSMEQIWLAFLMYEKYQKQWNGEVWIKIKKGTKELLFEKRDKV